MSRLGAWIVFTIIWHSSKQDKSPILAASDRVESLWDLLHSSGSLLLSALFSLGFWWCLFLPYIYIESCLRIWIVIILGVIIIVLMAFNARRVARIALGVTEGVFWQYMNEQSQKEKTKKVICSRDLVIKK